MPVADHSWKHWEQCGFPPAPCREVLHDAAEYQRCMTKAFDRCHKERCKGCGVGWPFQDYFRPGYDERQRRDMTSRSSYIPDKSFETAASAGASLPDVLH